MKEAAGCPAARSRQSVPRPATREARPCKPQAFRAMLADVKANGLRNSQIARELKPWVVFRPEAGETRFPR